MGEVHTRHTVNMWSSVLPDITEGSKIQKKDLMLMNKNGVYGYIKPTSIKLKGRSIYKIEVHKIITGFCQEGI